MKIRLYLVVVFIVMILFVGCGNSRMSQEELQSNLEKYLQDEYLDENDKLVEVKITDWQTEEEENRDSIRCTIVTEDEKYRYEKKAIFIYVLDNEGEWCMDDFSVEEKFKWIITPLTGVDKEQIAASLIGMTFTVNNEIWNIKEDNIESVSIADQKTDLAALTDTVTVNITINDKVQRASGQAVIHYIFDNEWNIWMLDSMSGKDSFTAETKAGLDLNVTEEILLDTLSGQIIEYGINNIQDITLNKDEISDFVIEKQEASEKGSIETYFCKGILTKPHATFTIEMEAPYWYSDGWKLQPVVITAKCASVELEGKWTGSNVYGHSCELDITEIDENGNINAVYSDNGDRFNKGFSYYVSGSIDLNNLRVDLEAGEVIESNGWRWFDNITAVLYADSSKLFGRSNLQFTLTQ